MRIGQIRILKFFVILCVLLGVGYVCNKVIKTDKSQQEINRRINPSIYPAVQSIENYAYEYIMKEEVNRREYDRCKELIRSIEEEAAGEWKSEDYSGPDAIGRYAFLEYLGFKLPPLYLEREPTKEEKEKAEKELGELKLKSQEILNKYTEFFLKETDKYLKELEKRVKK